MATYTYDPYSRRTNLTYGTATHASIAYNNYTAAGDLPQLVLDMVGTGNDNTWNMTYTNAHQLASDGSTNSNYLWQAVTTGCAIQGCFDLYAAVNAANQYPTVTPSLQGGAQTQIWGNDGNLHNDATTAFSYDQENRLINACRPQPNCTSPTLNATYAYDPLGRRVEKSGTGTTTTFFLQDGDDEIAEYSSATTLVRRFVPGPAIDEPIAMVPASGTKEVFYTDHHGSIVATSDTSGNLVEGPFTYDPYGNCYSGGSACTQSSTSEPFKYTGQYADAETGLLYYRARMYGPDALHGGRFLQTDPVGYKDDLNLYTYVGNDPTNMTDPTGRAVGIDDAIGFFVGGTIGVGVEFAEDSYMGQQMSWGDAAGAFVSGGVVGVGAVNAPETGGVSFAAAVGGLAGAAGNATKQGVDIATGAQKSGFSTKDVAVSGAVGAMVGGVTEGVIPDAKIPGLSSGRGNMNAVGKGIKTKIAHGNAKNMSLKTAVKAAVGSQASDAYRTAASAAADIAQKSMRSSCSTDSSGHTQCGQ